MKEETMHTSSNKAVCHRRSFLNSSAHTKTSSIIHMNHHLIRRLAACLLAATAMLSYLPAARSAEVTSLRCEYRDNPLGIDAAKPRLSWKIEAGDQRSEARGQKQCAYQVLVASSPELLVKDQGDLWDCGKVASDQSIQVEYAGKP